MARRVVDTNVAVVANGRPVGNGGSRPTALNRLKAIDFLDEVLKKHQVVLDIEGRVQAEYHVYLNPQGQPGVGDRFYQEILNSAPRRVRRIALPKSGDGSYVDFPSVPELQRFDQSDRKFAALARRAVAPVANAVDSDWLDFKHALAAHGVRIIFVCGEDKTRWFD